MNDNKNKKVNWINIIFKEFLQYLDLELIKEISLLSKLVRYKLKPKLFRDLHLSPNNIDYKDSVFTKYFNYKYNHELDSSIPKSSEAFIKSLSIEKGQNFITYVLKDIKNFAKSFFLDDVDRAGYYLFPIINIFDNLTILKLRNCVIPFIEFAKLGNSLPNLVSIELILVVMAKLPSDNIILKDLVFPPYLNYLEIYHCEVTKNNLLSDPYEFLFNRGRSFECNKFKLPKTLVPFLKKLVFYDHDSLNVELADFIGINNSLESLNIQYFNFNLISKLKSLKSLEIDIISSLDSNIQIHTLDSIIKLKINSVQLEYFNDVKKISLLCPNLTYLHFIISHCVTFQPSIDNFLLPITYNLPKLKTLELLFTTNEDESLEFKNFYQIEKLILETESSTIFNLKFENCKKLKNIKFTSYTDELNTKEFKDRFNTYNNWIFKYTACTIKGYKISTISY